MTKLYITEAHVAAFDRAARSSAPKREGNAVFRQIKADFGIPAHVKLGVDRDADDDTKNALYIKGSRPRVFLHAGADGRYATQPITPASDNGQAQDGRFITVNGQVLNGWNAMDRAPLLELLRSAAGKSTSPTLPAGFPADTPGNDALVLDNATGTIYWRA